MRWLLDTHVWLWYLLGDPRLPKKYRNMIQDPEAELWLSPISVWEAHVLIEKERLPVTDAPEVWIRKALRVLPVREAGVTFAISVRARAIQLDHQDPADRFIAATAVEMKLMLLTSDARLRDCPEVPCA